MNPNDLRNPYENLRIIYFALVKAYDTYITPLGPKRVKCWKYKLNDNMFILGMTTTVGSFTGKDEINNFGYTFDMKYWDDIKVMEVFELPIGADAYPVDFISRL